MQTFKGIYNQVLRMFDEAGTTSTTLDVVKDAVNSAHALYCAEYPETFLLWPWEETLTTVVGQRRYVLHHEYDKPFYFFNVTANRYLAEIPRRMLQDTGLNWNNATGSSEHFIYAGEQYVQNQPTSASVISIVSSNVADTGATLQVVVKGEDSNGVIKAEVFTPNGTSTVTGSVSFRTILEVTKEAAWTGTLTVTANSGAVTVVSLQACEMGRRYTVIELLSAPTVAETIKYRFFRKPLQLVNDFDQPLIRFPYSQVITFEALLYMSAYNPEVKPTDLAYWREQRERWKRALENAFQEQMTLGAAAQTMHDYDGFGLTSRLGLS